MRISFDKQRLAAVVGTVEKAVSARSTLPILECIYIEAEEGRRDTARVIANDLQLAIEAPAVACEASRAGCVSIPARLFSEIIRKMPEGTLTITADERNVVNIKSGKTEFKILGLPGIDFPYPVKVEKAEPYRIGCADFKDMIRRTIFAAAAEDTRQVMTGELLRIEGRRFSLAALDGFRIAVANAEAEGDLSARSAVIPAKTLSELAKILPAEKDRQLEFYFSESYALFEIDDYKIVTRLLDGDFVNFENIFAAEPETVIFIDRQRLQGAVERAMLISTENKKNPVKFNVRPEGLTVSSNSEAGTVSDEIPVEFEGKELEISFNPRYIDDVLKVMTDETVKFQFTTPLSPVIVKADARGEEGAAEKYRFLTLPLRVKN